MKIFSSPVHPLNAYFPIVLTDEGMFIDFTPSQPAKHPSSSVITEDGRFIVLRLVQYSKHRAHNVIIVFGKLISDSLRQLENAFSPIYFKFSGNTTFSNKELD